MWINYLNNVNKWGRTNRSLGDKKGARPKEAQLHQNCPHNNFVELLKKIDVSTLKFLPTYPQD